MLKLQNINTGEVQDFESEAAFLKRVQEIYRRNEDPNPYPSEIHWLPDTVEQATEYINEYSGTHLIS